MSENELIPAICEVVCDHLAMPEEEVEACIDVPFMEYPNDEDGNPYCDELDFQELLMAFEEEFGVEIPIENECGLTTIRDVAKYIEAIDKEIEESNE